jgi:hypothetical protein
VSLPRLSSGRSRRSTRWRATRWSSSWSCRSSSRSWG